MPVDVGRSPDKAGQPWSGARPVYRTRSVRRCLSRLLNKPECRCSVFADVILVAQVKRRGVEEALTGPAQDKRTRVQAGGGLGGELTEDGVLAGLQYKVESAKDHEGTDHLAVFRLLVVAAQEVGDRSDEGREGLVVYCSSGVAWRD